MNFKYYDLLSNLTIGMVVFYAVWKMCFPEMEISEWVVIPAGYLVGYFLDAFSSLIEPVLYKIICGKPSDVLLSPISGREWTGIKKVKFYYAEWAVELLKKDIKDDKANPDKMFGYAKLIVNDNLGNRVPDFKCHYALSRVIFTTVILAIVLIEVKYYDIWYSWLISVSALLLAGNRFRVRGYYYAREVLNEYLKYKESK